VTASSPTAPLRGALISGLALALAFAGLFLGLMFVVGCSENLRPGTDRTRVCDSMQGDNGYRWWLAVLTPALVLLLSQAVPWFRRHAVITATSIALVMGAFWAYVLVAVS
jgi:hypothetical protein